MRVQILIFRFKVLTGVFTYKCFHLNTKFNCLSFVTYLSTVMRMMKQKWHFFIQELDCEHDHISGSCKT